MQLLLTLLICIFLALSFGIVGMTIKIKLNRFNKYYGWSATDKYLKDKQ